MKKKKKLRNANFLKDIDSEHLIKLLEGYDYDLLNKQPYSEKELYKYYEKYTDLIVTESRRFTGNNVFPLSNEVRAMLGHLADYRVDPSYRRNLENAYGHFRRLNIDAFKILCDEADKSLLGYLNRHKFFDFRNVNSDFLRDYATRYFKAKNLYIDAQKSERTGSDRQSGNALKKYCDACLEYARLLEYQKKEKKGLNKEILQSIAGTVFLTLLSIASIVTSIIHS